MVEVVINENDGFVSITASGGETDLDFDFPIYEKSHLTIIRTRSGTDTTLVLDTDYTIATDQLEVTAGGTAVLAGASSPALAADVYTLLLDVPEERTTDFNSAGDFFAATLNRELDLQTQQIQALRRDVNKSARLPDTSTLTELPLPDPSANLLLGWNAAADGLENKIAADVGVTVISAYIETLLDDTTAAAARSTLGLATAALTDAENTFTQLITTKTSNAAGSGLRVPHGTAPSSPQNGDIWTTTSGVLAQVNAATLTLASLAGAESLTNKTIVTGSGNDVQQQTKIVVTTYDTATASGTQDITGFGFNPRACDIIMGVAGGGAFYSHGFADAAAQGCDFVDGAGTRKVTNTLTVAAQTTAAVTQATGVVSFITDGIRLTWTKVGSPTGTITMLIRGYR